MVYNETAELISLAEQRLASLIGLVRLTPPQATSTLREANELLEQVLHLFEQDDASTGQPSQNRLCEHTSNEDFLIEEGLDLLATYRAIKSVEARKTIMIMIAAVAHAEPGSRFEPQ